MDSVLFLAFLIAMVIIVYWAWRNDKVPIDKPTSGLLRMPRGPNGEQPVTDDEATGATSRNRPPRKPEAR